MGTTGRALRTFFAAAALAAGFVTAAPAAIAAPASISAEAGDALHWVTRSRDHAARPFAIVDKRAARIHVFDAAGRHRGTSVVLVGQALGDESAPNVGLHAQQGHVPVHERTTPAGRFVSEPGHNLKGEAVVWVDYEAAFAIHRLRGGAGLADRQVRLATPTPDDNRASLGCVVVPVAFYEDVVQRELGRGRAVIYVLPENGSLRDFLSGV